jgi:Glu-tRNA(Gln) amidotransferase subunit E-like FAD-binding protein
MDQIEKKVFKWLFGENPGNWSKSDTKLAVLAVILQKSRKQNQAITAISLRQIKAGLKKHYNKDLSERQILNVIRSLGKVVVKEKDPRDQRRTLYRINPNAIEEMVITLIKLNNETEHTNNNIEGILSYPFSSTQKKKFLAIGHKHMSR